MPANRMNYLVLYRNESQVYGTATKEIALETPPPPGVSLEDKRVLFITYQPDNEILSVHKVPQEEVLNAEIKEKKTKKDKA
jgi:hypothetical protein